MTTYPRTTWMALQRASRLSLTSICSQQQTFNGIPEAYASLETLGQNPRVHAVIVAKEQALVQRLLSGFLLPVPSCNWLDMVG